MAAPQITLVGNVTKDPELKYGGGGGAWGFFTVANTKWKKTDSGWEEAGTSFYDVKVFGQMMENVAESVFKGTKVVVLARCEQENWEKDGQKRSKMVFIADEVAVSLKNATAEVTKVERSDTTNGGYQDQPLPAPKDGEEPFLCDAGAWDPQIGYGTWPERML